MPVNRLLVEGHLDAEIFGPIFTGNPVVTGGSPKGSLPPRTRDIRRDTGVTACYVRDRDFDFLPPADLSQPAIDTTTTGNAILGWHWCRHEIENYLIDPSVINAVFGWDQSDFAGQLIAAAKSIRHYQVARWTMGQSRQVLPPARELPSKPTECIGHEFRLPKDLTLAGMTAWVHTQAAEFLANVHGAILPVAMTATLASHSGRLTDTFLGDVSNVLVWCSGKDLLARLEPWLQASHRLHPSQLRMRVRDWIVSNPDQALVLLPEWEAFRNLLRTYP